MRAFVAINLPEADRQRLYDTLAPVRSAGAPVRWTPPESLHLTLKFLGSIDAGTTHVVERILLDVVSRHATFDVDIAGLGAFPGLSRPRVWWVGVNDAPRLLALQDELDRALEQAGFAREQRPYSPHVTVGRTKERARIGAVAGAAIQSFDYRAHVPVRTIDLMESRLSPRGARYERMLAVPLGAERDLERTAAP